MSIKINLNMMNDVVVLSALLHDIGKANIAFQERLSKKQRGGDYYRHEWLSLKLFVEIVGNSKTDRDWLTKLASIDSNNLFTNKSLIAAIDSEIKEGTFEKSQINNMPPLAQWVAWLIVTHHRLPPSTNTHPFNIKKRKAKLLRGHEINSAGHAGTNTLYSMLMSFDGWQKNPVVAEKHPKRAEKSLKFKRLISDSACWRVAIAKSATSILSNPLLFNADDSPIVVNPIDDNYLMYLSRLLLILSDHNYSSIDVNDTRRIAASSEFSDMYANSNASDGSIRQSLDEHLLGVASFTHKLASTLPTTITSLPALSKHALLGDDTTNERFAWQNDAVAAARNLREHSNSHGFFGVNLASTGCGKTIGNARIMYALADTEIGARFTVALGLRVLTLQTGQQFRDNLSLTNEQVAVVVGGDASRDLYEINKNQSVDDNSNDVDASNTLEVSGSESSDSLFNLPLDGGFVGDYEGMDTVLSNSKARKMLLSPILTCTIDHLIHASESLHGGSHIPPALRLLSSDLILDEPDDFGVDDMYALSRLVFTAGMLGSRVLLSSATLTPSIVKFLFDAYWTGRNHYNLNNNLPVDDALKVACLFVDEQALSTTSAFCNSHNNLGFHYSKFIKVRTNYLDTLKVRRSAEIIPIDAEFDRDFQECFFETIAQNLVDSASVFHDRYHDYDAIGCKRVSIGLVRLAYTKSIVAVAQQLASTTIIPPDTHIYFCCYHSRQILALRSSLESKLDFILNRSDGNKTLFDCEYVSNAISGSTVKNHIFIVLATPIAEVGRDHDYDWAIIEPSSMRSIIQLVGRVWRHRPNKATTNGANVGLLQYNIRYFTRNANPHADQKVFIHSGFETDDNQISSYDVNSLISDDVLCKIDSKSRINQPQLHPISNSLSELEHSRLCKVLAVDELCLANSVWNYKARMYSMCSDIQVLTPFREQLDVDIEYVANPTNTETDFYTAKDLKEKNFAAAPLQNHILSENQFYSSNNAVSCWLECDINNELEMLLNIKNDMSRDDIVKSYLTVRLRDDKFSYNSFLGFYNE